VVSDAEKCRRNEVALAWNQNGGGDGQGSFLVGGFLNFSIPSHSSSTPPSSTSTPIVVTTTVLVNGADTDLEVVVPNSALPVVTIDLVHEVTIHQGEIISIRATLSGGGLASHSVYTISGNLCASEDVCSMAAPRDGTLKNMVVNSLVRILWYVMEIASTFPACNISKSRLGRNKSLAPNGLLEIRYKGPFRYT